MPLDNNPQTDELEPHFRESLIRNFGSQAASQAAPQAPQGSIDQLLGQLTAGARDNGSGNISDAVKAKWIAAGATPQAAEGIARRINVESGFNPSAVGDSGTSIGLYEHHGERADRLKQFAQTQGKPATDPFVQTDFAISEMRGGDPIAAAHAKEILTATDPNVAYQGFTNYFERPKTLRDQMFTRTGAGDMQQRLTQFYQEIGEQSAHDRSEYERIANSTDPGSAERRQLLLESRDRARHYRDVYAEFARNPPAEKPIDALQNFGSVGTMLALLIGGMGRHHMNGALGAAGAMMQAAQANNHEEFERQFKIWDHRSSIALNLAQMEAAESREIMADERASQAEKEARLDHLYKEHGMTWQADQMRAGLLEHALQADEKKEAAASTAAAQKFAFGMQMAQQEIAAHPERDPAEVYAKWGLASPAGVKAAQKAGGSPISDQDAEYWGNVLKSGGHLPPGFARSMGPDSVRKIMGKVPGLSGGDPGAFIAAGAVVKADAASLTSLTKMTDAAVSFEKTASRNFDLALKLSKDAIPTDWGPWLNKWIETGETQAGNTNVPPYVTAMLTGANEYAKIMSGSTGAQGATVDSRREAAELFSPYLAKGQIERVVAVAKADMENRKQSLTGQLADITARIHSGGLEPSAPGAERPPSAPQVPIARPEVGQQQGSAYGSPNDVYRAFDDGKISKDQAKQILIDRFGAKPQ